jgi:hypothetical protein
MLTPPGKAKVVQAEVPAFELDDEADPCTPFYRWVRARWPLILVCLSGLGFSLQRLVVKVLSAEVFISFVQTIYI